MCLAGFCGYRDANGQDTMKTGNHATYRVQIKFSAGHNIIPLSDCCRVIGLREHNNGRFFNVMKALSLPTVNEKSLRIPISAKHSFNLFLAGNTIQRLCKRSIHIGVKTLKFRISRVVCKTTVITDYQPGTEKYFPCNIKISPAIST